MGDFIFTDFVVFSELKRCGCDKSLPGMATKRVAATAVDWAEFARKIPPANKGAFQALKTKQDSFVRTINQLPDSLPAIDFAAYRGRIAPAMVDDFEKKYKGLEIPYPKDTTAAELAGEGAKQKAAYEKYVAESQARCGTVTTELAKWEGMMPVEEMNKEDQWQRYPILYRSTDRVNQNSGLLTRISRNGK